MLTPMLVMALAIGQVTPGAPPAPPGPATLGNPTPLGAPSATPQSPYTPYAVPNGSLAASPYGSNECNDDWCFCCFFKSVWHSYMKEFGLEKEEKKNGEKAPEPEPEKPARRALPEPWSSPPYPGHEWQGYPLVGVPPSADVYPLMQAVYDCCPCGDAIKDSRIKLYGWVTAAGTWSNAQNTNSPAAYWQLPNSFALDQVILRLEREPDMVQTDHVDWGFRSTALYGEDYRYIVAGGWFSSGLLKQNRLYGFDPTEQYIDVYFPTPIINGMVIRVGRWVACPDIETQLAPDNYLGSHSLLFTFDTYTQTGVMATFCLNNNWMVQGAITAGTDMAPWYVGATPTGFAGIRWVSNGNHDAIYTCLNNFNNAEFQHFEVDGQPAGHDNYNYIVSTWEHRFNDKPGAGSIVTKTEGYYMWQKDAEIGGTPSIGPVQPFGGGGGDGVLLPGWSHAYGVLNYSMWAFTDMDYLCFRNEWWKDDRGMRSGFAGNYQSCTLGWSHNFNAVFQIRPEIGWYRNWNQPAFDLGTKQNLTLYGFDMTLRF